MIERGEKMESGITYSLEINGEGTRNSFNYETMSKASEAYKFLSSKFSAHRIINKNSITSADEIVQLTISDMFIGTFPINTMASIIPEDCFNKEVYDEMLKAAREYYEKTNKLVID
jgi:hypothetical protein